MGGAAVVRTIVVVDRVTNDDADELVLDRREIEADEDTTGWLQVIEGTEVFLCSPDVVDALLWIGRPHTDDDP